MDGMDEGRNGCQDGQCMPIHRHRATAQTEPRPPDCGSNGTQEAICYTSGLCVPTWGVAQKLKTSASSEAPERKKEL